MKFFLIISFSLFLFSCSQKSDEWKLEWGKHEKDFKKVISLINAKQLQLTPEGMYYIIPGNIKLEYPCNQKVLILDDANKEESSSYLFFLDTAQRPFRKNPVLVYTTNKLRKGFYETDFKENVVKIEDNWYFLYN